MARRGSRSRGGKVIDNVHWLPFIGVSLAQAAGSAAISLVSTALTPFTIMRTRGTLVASIDGAGAPGGLVQVGVGMIVVPEGTGGTVLQSPINDANADWFWYETFVLGYEEMVTDVVDVPGITSFRATIDSKAMRRMLSDTEIQLVIEQATLATSRSVNVAVAGRVLLGN